MHSDANTLNVQSRRILFPEGVVESGQLLIKDGYIAETVRIPPNNDHVGDFLVLPGMIDLHGDSFERQMMPRAGVSFPADIALADNDAQLLANGITTAFYGVTVSWEPGLRGEQTAERIIRDIVRLRESLMVDSRIHLRFEVLGIDSAPAVLQWIEEGIVDLLAFNDHADFIAERVATKPQSIHKYLERTSLAEPDWVLLLETVRSRKDGISAIIERLAKGARQKKLPMASHDDDSPATRRRYESLGCEICEFPMDRETALEASLRNDPIVLGAPNVIRGGSHVGRLDATGAIRNGLCTVLSSDYYYPSMLHAVFQLARTKVASLPDAWALVSRNAAAAAGLHDRGEIAVGKRADIILVDDSNPHFPRVAAVIANGKLAFRGHGLPQNVLSQTHNPVFA